MSKKGHLQGIRAIAIISVLAFHFFPEYFPNGFLGVDHVSARIWQFLAGFLIYFWSEDDENKPKNEEQLEKLLIIADKSEVKKEDDRLKNTWLLLVTILMLFFSFEYPEKMFRVLITINTALLILASENNVILSNRIMIYIGNISYSLYLVHWPIYCYSKFYELPKLPFLCFSIFLAILVYETYEKWYTTKITRTSQMILSASLFIFCVLAIWRQEINDFYLDSMGRSQNFDVNPIFLAGNSKNLSLEEVMHLNTEWTLREKEFLSRKECNYTNHRRPFGVCNVQNLTSSAPFKILIIGNSYATNFAPLVFNACGKKSNTILLASFPSCDFLHPYFPTGICLGVFDNPYEKIEKMNFDYIFLISKCGTFCENDDELTDIDTKLEFAKSQIARIKPFVKHKIFIQKAVTIPTDVVSLNKFLANHTSFDKIDEYYSQRLKHHKFIGDARHRKLAEFCGEKCEYFDAFENFQRNPYAPKEIFRFFDKRGLSYIDGADHFPPFAWPKIQPVFDRICEKL
ncbi:unnamed protein product [Caenorhabditis angaria]|uniref:SGNH domain-containing protein n=1 Tax=Caenorhabditis angaria TaxID=860376 RepID=A0A9P1IUC7_9PELO|nr:unnamed protein product [Caenorhabditis angaria]